MPTRIFTAILLLITSTAALAHGEHHGHGGWWAPFLIGGVTGAVINEANQPRVIYAQPPSRDVYIVTTIPQQSQQARAPVQYWNGQPYCPPGFVLHQQQNVYGYWENVGCER